MDINELQSRYLRVPYGCRLFAFTDFLVPVRLRTHWTHDQALQIDLTPWLLNVRPTAGSLHLLNSTGNLHRLEGRSREAVIEEIKMYSGVETFLKQRKKKKAVKVMQQRNESLLFDILASVKQQELRQQVHNAYLQAQRHRQKQNLKQKVTVQYGVKLTKLLPGAI